MRGMYVLPGLAVVIAATAIFVASQPSTGPAPVSTNRYAIQQTGQSAFGDFSAGSKVSIAAPTATTEAGDAAVRSTAGTTDISILPVPSSKRYEYIYSGSVTIPDFAVLRREPNMPRANLTSALSAASGMRLDSFSNLTTDTVTLSQNQGGYSVTIDYNEGTMSLYRQVTAETTILKEELIAPDRTVTTNTTVPSERLSDDTAIRIANEFLSTHGVDRTGLGAPVVRQDVNIAFARDLAAPEFFQTPVMVVYPWSPNGQRVVDDGGQAYGLTVTIDSVSQLVTSIWNITPLKFTASAYEIEKNPSRILSFAKRGGLYAFQPEPAEGIETVQISLGTPQAVYLVSRYQLGDGTHDFLVPALIFPVINVPKGETLYQSNILVPVVKELLDTADKNTVGGSAGAGSSVSGTEPSTIAPDLRTTDQ